MPRVFNPNAVENSLPGIIKAQKQRLDDLAGAAMQTFYSFVVGAGGMIVNGATQLLGGVTGGLNVTGALGVTGAISSTTTVTSTGDTNVGGNLNLTGSGYFPQAYNNPVTTGTYYAAYLNGGDSRLGRTASSRRYKQDISTLEISAKAVLALRIVQFRWKAEVEAGRDQGYDFGVIAEELNELGLTPWVFYNEAGEPEGVHYERLFLMALPLIQQQQERLDAIEQRLAAAGI